MTTWLWAAVQELAVERTSLWGLNVGTVGAVCYFAADPHLDVDDVIYPWAQRLSGTWARDGRVLKVLGPARDMGGQGEAYQVRCVSHALRDV